MSIAAIAISEAPVAAEPPLLANASGRGKPPSRRTVIAISDVVAAPEPR